jgi:hypothetical protein
LGGRFGLARIVAQDIAQVVALAIAQGIFHVGSVYFVVVIVLVVDLILRKYRDCSGENRGY